VPVLLLALPFYPDVSKWPVLMINSEASLVKHDDLHASISDATSNRAAHTKSGDLRPTQFGLLIETY
jgi:hypothetical protein